MLIFLSIKEKEFFFAVDDTEEFNDSVKCIRTIYNYCDAEVFLVAINDE